MEFVDGRGQNKKEEAKANTEKVRLWYEENQKSTFVEACKGTGLSYKTLKRCVNELKERQLNNGGHE